MTIKDLLEDLLIEYDELGMEPTTVVPNPSERAMVWKRELMCALKHLRAEVAREIFEELDKKIFHHIPDLYTFEIYTEIKKKYTDPSRRKENSRKTPKIMRKKDSSRDCFHIVSGVELYMDCVASIADRNGVEVEDLIEGEV